MTESPRPEDLGEQRTRIDTDEPEDDRAAADPRSETGARGALTSMPYWFVVIGVVLVAVIALTLVWFFFPPR